MPVWQNKKRWNVTNVNAAQSCIEQKKLELLPNLGL